MLWKSVLFTSVFFLLATSPTIAAAGEISVVNNGAPVGAATVSVQSLDGKPLATTQTNMQGIAKADLPASAAGQPVVYRVADKAGNVSEQIYAQPSGQASELVAMDTNGGITGYDKGAYDHLVDAKKPLAVGANKDVGCGSKLKGKAKKAFGGLLSGAASQALGGKSPLKLGGSGSGGGNELKTKPDPIAKKDKRIFTDPSTGTRIAVGSQFTPDGLQVSSNILNAPCNGSFQSVYLMDAQGNKAGPTRYDIYEMYQDWWLTVNWTYDRWEGNDHVEHKQGGWSDEGRDILGTFAVPREGDGIWNRLGFSNAVQGIKGLGTFFPVGPSIFNSEPMTLVVHVVNADGKPVTTVPFVIGLAPSLVDELTSTIKYREMALEAEVKLGEGLMRNALSKGQLDQSELDLLQHEIEQFRIDPATAVDVATKPKQHAIDELIKTIRYKKKRLAVDEKFWGDLGRWSFQLARQRQKIRKLEKELERLRIDSVIDHLQPIIVLA